MRARTALALASYLAAAPAAAQGLRDAAPAVPPADAAPGETPPDAGPEVPALPAAPAVPPPLAAPAAAPLLVPAPRGEPSTPRLTSLGPSDEEAKADFQDSRALPDGSPLRFSDRTGTAELYGFAKLDILHDSTQSYGAFAPNATLERPHTFLGDNGHETATLCTSRLGGRFATPGDRLLQGVALAELGPSLDGSDLCQGNRVRHLYLAARSPILDVLVGRYFGLLGWGGKGFLPNTVAIVVPPGQLYHFEDQVRLSHIFRTRPVDVELAGAVGRFAQQDPSGIQPELGLRIAVNRWRGASAQGAGPPVAAPLQVGVSWAHRVFEVNDFVASPGSARVSASNHILAFDLFAPIVPARGDDLSDSASLTLEATAGQGFADCYPGLTGGVLFPVLPNPARQDPTNPPPVYVANIPPALVTFNTAGDLVLIEWRTLVLGAQYHLPFQKGRRAWLSAVLSRTQSSNVAPATPQAVSGGVWSNASYADINGFVAVTNALQLALSYQETWQTFLDGVVARNMRTQLSAAYFF